MIPVTPKPEPDNFDGRVRQPGLRWLRDNGIAHDQPPPSPVNLHPYWREILPELWARYDGVCAYLCIYFAQATGAATTDHFIAKSSNAGQAYEWNNFRLACLAMNRNKNRYDDVLDPFCIEPNTFFLDLTAGKIYPNPTLSPDMIRKAAATIARLGLDDPDKRTMRTSAFDEYLRKHVDEDYLRRRSPFIWYEAHRQRLL